MQIVRVKNIGSSPFKSKYDSESYTVPPGSESLVPYAAMILWAGNPDARNIDARQRNRTLEVNRIRVKYGAYENEEKWAVNKPSLEFHTMDGERIWTVMDDPEGDHTNPLLNDEQSSSNIATQLSNVQTQLASVMEMISTGKLVLADGADSTNVDDAADAAKVADPMPPTIPSSLTPSLAKGTTPPVLPDGPPLAKAEPADDASDSPSGPPTDSPKSVKIGAK